MIRQHGGFAEKATPKSHARRIELRQVHLDDIVLPDQFCRDQPKGRRNDAFAEAEGYRHADDAYAIHHFLAWQRFFILRGHHGHFVPAFGKCPRQPLGVDGQARGMRTVVGENGQYFHKAGRLYPSPATICDFLSSKKVQPVAVGITKHTVYMFELKTRRCSWRVGRQKCLAFVRSYCKYGSLTSASFCLSSLSNSVVVSLFVDDRSFNSSGSVLRS